jgi:hypothetical protein
MGSAVETAMTVRYRGKGLSVARGLFLVFGYSITSTFLAWLSRDHDTCLYPGAA